MSKTISQKQLHSYINFYKTQIGYEDKSVILFPISDTENIEIEVKEHISPSDMNSLALSMADNMFNERNQYTPALYTYIYANAILAYFTNIDITKLTMDMSNNIIYYTDMIQQIEERINHMQLKDIKTAIDKAIEYKQKELMCTQEKLLNDNLFTSQVYTQQIADITKCFNGIDIKQLSEMVDKITSINQEQLLDVVYKYNKEFNNQSEEINTVETSDNNE